ncbi:hypothetical protein PLESTM_000653500 [Pleodorina starrii]|nr:hypothetical protein PLESTM_000653500 [Pleodorina starrii]
MAFSCPLRSPVVRSNRGTTRKNVKPAAMPAAIVIAVSAAKLAFLPWNGCEVPGSPYSTGVKGVPGKDCQEVYQPAAAAEARAVERLRQQQMPDFTQAERIAPQSQGQRPEAPVEQVKPAPVEALNQAQRQQGKALVDSQGALLE